MKKMKTKEFLAEKPDHDRVVAVRIKRREIYLLAWMPNEKNYRIQAAYDISGYFFELDKDYLFSSGNLIDAVQNVAIDAMDNLYCLDANGNVAEEDREFDDEYDRFLSLFTFGRFSCGRTKETNLHILEISQKELQEFGDLLRDGDYILIMEKNISKAQKQSFEQECYEAYQLEWMMSHGYNLDKTVNAIMDIVTEDLEDPENEFPQEAFEVSNTIYKCYEQFVNEVGFQGEIFACKEEFLKEEFLSATYMDRLLSLMPESAKKMALWKKIVEGGAADEQ